MTLYRPGYSEPLDGWSKVIAVVVVLLGATFVGLLIYCARPS